MLQRKFNRPSAAPQAASERGEDFPVSVGRRASAGHSTTDAGDPGGKRANISMLSSGRLQYVRTCSLIHSLSPAASRTV